jgi:hypothetical protein
MLGDKHGGLIDRLSNKLTLSNLVISSGSMRGRGRIGNLRLTQRRGRRDSRGLIGGDRLIQQISFKFHDEEVEIERAVGVLSPRVPHGIVLAKENTNRVLGRGTAGYSEDHAPDGQFDLLKGSQPAVA